MKRLQEAAKLCDKKPQEEHLKDFTFDVPFFSPHHLVVIADNYMCKFALLWDFFKPKNYLVIGVLVGSSESYALWKTKHKPERIVVCDVELIEYNPKQTNLASVYKNIVRYFPNELVMMKMDSQKTDTMRKLGPYDLIFVDGEHSKTGVMNDLDHAAASMSETGVILVHDIDLTTSGVREGYEEWLFKHPEMEHLEIPNPKFQLGLGMIQKKGKN